MAISGELGDLTLRDEHRLRRKLDRGVPLEKLAPEIASAEERLAKRRAAVPADITYPEELPVSARRDELLDVIRDNQVVIVAGETGSGKTTQLPKILLELGRGVRGAIAHTQPRRLAARTVAERIADELGVELGSTVGYAVRFSDRSREDTLVRLVTDGLLLAEIQHDRLLRKYDTIVIDEAHERSLNIDFLLGYLKTLLPRRPDLKVVITSATIDPERFAAHFDDAPIVEVSGRTYPVEVRYRPSEEEEEQDPVDAIGDAVDELMGEAPGDVLVFLSGEREIRDTADALRGRLASDVEILPLYARLSHAEQHRVFKPSGRRRVVLATNVAETSLTVPGIKYVVDPGTARISRYSARLKVQRLPIEPVSQASADQRKGRSGRTSAGVAIRLYSEEDFLERPRFTDPEILRTSLASVILQMASLRLGDVEDFPFLDPPDRRQVRDGVLLLQELGALDAERRLTPVGRRLASLPVDPRFARMVIEADELGAVDEVIVIVAALSIQDPRERPVEQRAQADQLHARFADEHSDFISYLNLWRYLREQQHELSSNQFRKKCKAEFLHYLRVREWQDLVQQLRQAARGAGVTRNSEPAEPAVIHQALLSGLLSHVGMRDVRTRGDYTGARGAKFAIFPGSKLSKKPPDWVMVAELVETSRLWGRTAARIDPRWIERLAGDLVKRSYSEPRWEKKRASVVATERVTLYGLPVVAGRTVPYGRIDPELSRELFIRRALVEGEWHTRHRFWDENQQLLKEVEELEHRVRQRGLVVDDSALFEFYDSRVPAEVVSGAHFDRWWKEERRRNPSLLNFTREMLVPADGVDEDAWPETWEQGPLSFDLAYRFEPGAADDGVTVVIPLRSLASVSAAGFEWLVPGLRRELFTALLRGLPKELRRPLVPVPDVVDALLARVSPSDEPLVDALAAAIREMNGPAIPRDAWDLSRLPASLRMRFRVVGPDGKVLGEGDDLETLRASLRPRLRAELGAAAKPLERRGLREWSIGELPRTVALPGTGKAVRAYPALVDEGDSVGVQMFDTVEAQAAAMRAGTRRLLLLTVPSPVRAVQDKLDTSAQLTLTMAPHGNVGAVVEDAIAAAVDALTAEAGGPAWDEAGFARLRSHVAGRVAAVTSEAVAQVVRILEAEREVVRRMEDMTAPQLAPSVRDVERQLRRLVYPGFVLGVGVKRLADVERYLRGAAMRLERLPSAVAGDIDRMRSVHELEVELEKRIAASPPGQPLPEALREVPWLLEELRVSHFAQGIGVRGQVSSKRVRKALDAALPG